MEVPRVDNVSSAARSTTDGQHGSQYLHFNDAAAIVANAVSTAGGLAAIKGSPTGEQIKAMLRLAADQHIAPAAVVAATGASGNKHSDVITALGFDASKRA